MEEIGLKVPLQTFVITTNTYILFMMFNGVFGRGFF